MNVTMTSVHGSQPTRTGTVSGDCSAVPRQLHRRASRARKTFHGRENGTRCDARRSAASPRAGLASQAATTPGIFEPLPSTDESTALRRDDLVVTFFRWPAQLAGRSVGVIGSFNSWSAPLPLARSRGGDWVRSIALPPGPIQFKFIVDGEYASSPCEACVSDGGSTYNNHRIVQTTCEFSWPSAALGGREVFVVGNWSGWQELLPLTHNARTGKHTLRYCLPPGRYTYQFLVDGEWRLLPDADAEHTPDEHFANVITVKSPPAFRIYYATGWNTAALRVRGLDASGGLVDSSWIEVPLHDTAGRGHPKAPARRWKFACVPADGPNPPAALEFVPRANDGTGAEDRPFGGGSYVLPGPGSYKLRNGQLRPFPRASQSPIMLVSDLDGTLVGEGPEADALTAEFAAYWEETAAPAGATLVYNTGRSLGQFLGLLDYKAGALPVPDALITAVGTKIFLLDRQGGTRGTASGSAWKEDAQWTRILDEGWNLQAVREAGAVAIAAAPSDAVSWLDEGNEHPHRIALSVRSDAVATVVGSLESGTKLRGVTTRIIVSGERDWRYVDVVSGRGGKLAALEYVRAMFGISVERCVAAGDSGNDALMLGGRNPAIVVGNAQPELLSWVVKQPQDGRLVVSDAPMARGVLEGLARLGLY